MAKTSFSVRNPLQGELIDFVRESGFDCPHLTSLMRDLTCLLASYREEDVPLFPEILILNSGEELGALSPGTQRIPLGNIVLDADAASKVLKDSANLAVRGWAVYVFKTAERTAQFGIFRALVHSFATSAEEAMVESLKEAAVILIRNRGHLVVELRNSRKEGFTAAFTSAPAAESPFAKHVADFAEATARVLSAARAGVVPAMTRLGQFYDTRAASPDDARMAHDWYGRAAAAGDDSAKAWMSGRQDRNTAR